MNSQLGCPKGGVITQKRRAPVARAQAYAPPLCICLQGPNYSLLGAMVNYGRSAMEEVGAQSATTLRQEHEEGGAHGLEDIQCTYPLHR